MSTTGTIDYDALARQAEQGKTAPTEPDYAALAQQAERGTPAPTTTTPRDVSGDWDVMGNLRQMVPNAIELGKGLVKGGMQTVAGALETPAAQMFLPAPPQATRTAANWLRQHATINSEGQQAGNIAETVGEFLALPEVEAEKAAIGAAEYYGKGAEMAKFLKANPKALSLMKIGLNTLRGGVEQGGQTYLKTGGDIPETEKAAGVGAVAGGALSTLFEGVGNIRRALSETAVAHMPPPPRVIEGAQFPTTIEGQLAVPEGGARAATQQAEAAMQNIGQRGIKTSLDRANLDRPVGRGTPPNPARLLPAEASPISTGATPEDLERFTVEGTPPIETVTQPSQEGSRIYGLTREVPNPDYTPAGTEPRGTPTEAELRRRQVETQAVPTRSITGEPTITIPNWQEIPPPTGGGDVLRHGGGPMILTEQGGAATIEKARATLNSWEDMLDDPELGSRAKAAIRNAYDDLSGQVDRFDAHVADQQRLYREAARAQTGMYTDFAASEPNFPLHDVDAAQNITTGIQSAGQNILDAHRPFFIEANRLTNGEFGLLTKRAQGLSRVIRDTSLSTTDRLARLSDLQSVNDQISQLFEQNRTRFTPAEWKIARDGWVDGSALKELGSFIEGHMGGITAEEAARRPGTLGMQRLFAPGDSFNEGLQKIYAKRGPALLRTIGRGGMDNLKELGILYQTPEDAQKADGIIKSIGTAILRHARGIRGMTAAEGVGGAIAGHLAAQALGVKALPAALATGTVLGTRRYVVERIASDPAFARKFIYAVKQGVSPRVAGTLLASRIIESLSKQAAVPPPDPYMAESNPRGLVEPGNLPIWNRPIIRNDDGSISSEYSMSREDNGREVLVPTIVNGRFLTPDGKKPAEGSDAEKAMFDEAWRHYQQTGEHLGKFSNPDYADIYAEKLHNRPMRGVR